MASSGNRPVVLNLFSLPSCSREAVGVRGVGVHLPEWEREQPLLLRDSTSSPQALAGSPAPREKWPESLSPCYSVFLLECCFQGRPHGRLLESKPWCPPQERPPVENSRCVITVGNLGPRAVALAAICPANRVRNMKISWREECLSLKAPRITPELARLTVCILKKTSEGALKTGF